MKKRTLCVLLAALISAASCGCGANSKDYSVADINAAEDTGVTAGAAKSDKYAGDSPLMEAADASDDYGVEAAVGDYGDAADAIGTAAGTADESERQNKPQAGQLTAGEWNDNENWGFFSNLVNSGTISYPVFGLNPVQRVTIEAKDKNGKPLVNAKAVLLDKSGNAIFGGVTNKDGIAYLFGTSERFAEAEVSFGGVSQKVSLESGSGSAQTKSDDTANTAGDISAQAVLDIDSKLYKALDVMFILDTTGSMSDEMLFLQSEFTAITDEIGTDNTRYAMNFYRDEGDDYVTRCNDFTDNIKSIQKALNKESAEGGGDYPEAVAEALNESIFNSSWKDESVKLAFLILDAPPHEEKSKEISEAIYKASEKGIRIIPVIASDSDRETELFGRAAAIYTGGTYVFLTDDSGIGNSHEEPIIGSYEVRSLYDTIVEIIKSYQQ